MQSFYFLLKCPACSHHMRYHTDTLILADKRKSCVYCGRSFKVKDNILKQER